MCACTLLIWTNQNPTHCNTSYLLTERFTQRLVVEVTFSFERDFDVKNCKTHDNLWRWISWLVHRWRTQQNAIRSVNCRIQWIIESLNANCAFGYSREHVCLSDFKTHARSTCGSSKDHKKGWTELKCRGCLSRSGPTFARERGCWKTEQDPRAFKCGWRVFSFWPNTPQDGTGNPFLIKSASYFTLCGINVVHFKGQTEEGVQ